jgi:hypothetical protein
VYTIWLPMLPGDSRADARDRSLADPRVINLWDPQRLSGRWLADHRTGSLEEPGRVVWDAFLGFDPSARWTQDLTGLVTAGSTIIGNTGNLERDFVPLL